MGADAEVYVFDYRRYRAEVVPALVELIRTGACADWLRELIRLSEHARAEWDALLLPHLRANSADLARYCTYLGEDLRYLGPDTSRGWLGAAFRPCPSTDCPERDRCPLHRARDRDLAEALNALFEAAVAARCLGAAQFVGRSMHPLKYGAVLDRMDVPADDPVRHLLAGLAMRGAVLGYGFSNSDGIHGWLTVEETAELADRLDELPLPRYEPTVAAMTAFHRRSPEGGLSYPAAEFDGLSLSFVRTVARIAAATGEAILWGNDLVFAQR